MKSVFDKFSDLYGTTDLVDYDFAAEKLDDEVLEVLQGKYKLKIRDQNAPIEQVAHRSFDSLGYPPRTAVFMTSIESNSNQEIADLSGYSEEILESYRQNFYENSLIISGWELTAQGKATALLLDYLLIKSAEMQLQIGIEID